MEADVEYGSKRTSAMKTNTHKTVTLVICSKRYTEVKKSQ